MNRKSGEETRFLSHFSKTDFRYWSEDSSKCFDSVDCGPVISLHKTQAQARKAACNTDQPIRVFINIAPAGI